MTNEQDSAVESDEVEDEDYEIDLGDNPIKDSTEDKYEFDILAKLIAKSIVENKNEEGTVVSILGKWGSGKSSLINLVESCIREKGIKITESNLEYEIQSGNFCSPARIIEIVTSYGRRIGKRVKNCTCSVWNDLTSCIPDRKKSRENNESIAKSDCAKSLIITKFDCWWLRGEEELISEFFRQIYQATRLSEDVYLTNLVKGLGAKVLMNFASVVSTVMDQSIPGSSGYITKLSRKIGNSLMQDTNLDDKYRKLRKYLNDHHRHSRYLIIIDDIDRLLPNEAFLIFKLIKTVGHLPKFTYLLGYDRSIATQILEECTPVQDITFLEKFVQAGFDVPHITHDAILVALQDRFRELIGEENLNELSQNHFKYRFRTLIAPCVYSPRNVTRVCNVLNITWRSVKNRLNFADFVAIETIRILHPELYITIWSHKFQVLNLGNSGEYDMRRIPEINSELLNLNFTNNVLDVFVEGLNDLFTSQVTFAENGGTIVDNKGIHEFRYERHLISSGSWFDSYFQFSLKDVGKSRFANFISDASENRELVFSILEEYIKDIEIIHSIAELANLFGITF